MIPGAIPPQVAAVAMAVARGARTVSEVAEAVGRPRGTAYDTLLRARMVGLVSWEDRRAGTLHSTLGVAASDLDR